MTANDTLWQTVFYVKEDAINHGDPWNFMEQLNGELLGTGFRVVYLFDYIYEVQVEVEDD